MLITIAIPLSMSAMLTAAPRPAAVALGSVCTDTAYGLAAAVDCRAMPGNIV